MLTLLACAKKQKPRTFEDYNLFEALETNENDCKDALETNEDDCEDIESVLNACNRVASQK